MTLTAELESKRKSKRRDAEIKALRVENEKLGVALLDARKSRVRIPQGKPPKAAKGSITRVIVPDSHGCYIDDSACKAFLADLEQWQPAEIVMLGDHLDCGGWLALHHTLGFVPETDYSFEDDVNKCNQFLDAIQQRAPGARMWYLEGNHEQRIRKEIIKLTLRHSRDSAYLLKLWGAAAVLHLKERNIEWIESGDANDGVQTKGILKLGKCLFTHGRGTGPNAAQKMLSDFKANICFGHTHRISTAMQESAVEPSLGAWSFGCLCQRIPLYYDTRPTHWAHGYGVQIVQPNGEFLVLQIPIIDGRSLLGQLAKALRAA